MKDITLCIDIGNSTSSVGIFLDHTLFQVIKIKNSYESSNDLYTVIKNLSDDRGFNISHIKDIIVASVVPQKNIIWSDFTLHYIKKDPLIIRHHHIKDIKNLYENPQRLGIDRLINVYYAIKNYNTNLLVIDFGTATTFDCINSQWEFLGGLIIPGIETMFHSLHQKTSLLPLIKDFNATENCLCRDTISAIKNGVILGYSEMTNGLINRIRKHMSEPLKVISTGGFGGLLLKYCTQIEEYIPTLTLEGIYLVYRDYLFNT